MVRVQFQFQLDQGKRIDWAWCQNNPITGGNESIMAPDNGSFVFKLIQSSEMKWIGWVQSGKWPTFSTIWTSNGSECAQNVSKMCPKCEQNVSKMCPKWVQNGSKMSLKCVQNESKMCPKWVQNMSKVGPKWVQNESKMGPKWVQNGSHDVKYQINRNESIRSSVKMIKIFNHSDLIWR